MCQERCQEGRGGGRGQTVRISTIAKTASWGEAGRRVTLRQPKNSQSVVAIQGGNPRVIGAIVSKTLKILTNRYHFSANLSKLVPQKGSFSLITTHLCVYLDLASSRPGCRSWRYTHPTPRSLASDRQSTCLSPANPPFLVRGRIDRAECAVPRSRFTPFSLAPNRLFRDKRPNKRRLPCAPVFISPLATP